MVWWLALFLVTGVEAQNVGCYSSGSVAGIVIATIVVTLIMGGLASASLWYLWKQRKGVPSEKSAFDNPYFKEEEKTAQSAEKGESGFRNGGVTQLNTKPSNGEQKKGPFSSLNTVFHSTSGKRQKTTTDDTYIPKRREMVQLRGADFTGLGFNICGNIREGIFVRDVMDRGPASRKIKAGDKLLGVFVSFSGMVYEDAVTILSYASPYDVRLEVETSSSSIPPKCCTGGLLLHPLYRSQSTDHLPHSTGIQKTLTESFAVPKRSQSVETSVPKSLAKSGDDVSSHSAPFNEEVRTEKEEETMPCILTESPSDGEANRPTAPPRTPKRKAPPPPALIHKEMIERSPHQSESERKASSLGDLTRLGATSSAILERAVSLDLQQSIPGENLIKQKKVLKAPSFGSDCDENREDAEVADLKRWDDQFLGVENERRELDDSVYSEKPSTDLQESETREMGKDVFSEKDDPLSSSVPISIPVIKPDLTNFEKLPPPDWRKSPEEASKPVYKPIFSSKEATDSVVTDAAAFAKTLIVSEEHPEE